MLELALKLLIAYLLGSISGSLVVGRFFGGVDIRRLGSGNAGGTNALRTQGPAFAFFVVVIDVGKGCIAAGWLPLLVLPGVAVDASVTTQWLTVGCAVAAITGHMLPFWHGFRGGKGGATLVGTLLVMAPVALALLLAVWGVALVITGYVGFSTMLSTLAVPVYALFGPTGPDGALLTFGLAVSLMVVLAHRDNIRRMLHGNENRSERAMLLRRPRQ